MTTARKDGTMRMKVTISRDEHPALFEALFRINNPRRRTGRLKDLVIRGLMLELSGGTLSPMGQQAVGVRAASAYGREDATAGEPRTTVSSMLEWDASHS